MKDGKLSEDGRPSAIRPEPKRKLSQQEREDILYWVNQPQYASRAPAFIVADLMDKESLYIASESSFYRVMRAAEQHHRRGRQKPPLTHAIPTTHVAKNSNEVWSWDISWLPGPVKGTWYYLYMAMDIYDRAIVGGDVYEKETAEYAQTFIEKAYWRQKLQTRKPVVLHSDNGSPMKAATFQQKLLDLGLLGSHSRPRVSNDNAFSEALFKTLKYKPSFPTEGFQSIEQARKWVNEFVHWYNNIHRHSALNFVTPMDRRNGMEKNILAKRQAIKQASRHKNPERWVNPEVQLIPTGDVHLNPDRTDCKRALK
jgi:transposase InsO family protein